MRLIILIFLYTMLYMPLVVLSKEEDIINPTNILEAVISARLQIPPSVMKFEVIEDDSILGKSYRIYSIIFDGLKRRFQSVDSFRDIALYNEKEIIYFDPERKVIELYSLTGGDFGKYVFDPRTFGMNPVYFPYATVYSALPIENVESIILIGKEVIETNSVWHIQITPGAKWNAPSFYKIDVWVDNRLRIHRYFENGINVYSYYDEKITKDLPYKVVSFPRDKRIVKEHVIHEFKHLTRKPDDSLWTLKGLDLPKGTPVFDIPARIRIGYWDGSKIVKNITEATASKPVSIWISIPIIILLSIIPLWLYIKARKR